MGQYYFPLLINNRGKRTTAYSHDFDNGLKLMEHSWVGNGFVNAVMAQIYNKAQRVAWVGDYSDGLQDKDYVLGGGFINNRESFMKYYKAANKCVNPLAPVADVERLQFCVYGKRNYYLINHTKGVYVDLEEYVANNTMEDGWCINPLPLLTCIGNGMGGGDYRGREGADLVGSWCFDKISVVDSDPEKVKGMRQVYVTFSEDL